MKKFLTALLIGLIATSACAQKNIKNNQKNSKSMDLTLENMSEPGIDPTNEVNVKELLQQRNTYMKQVVELTFDQVSGFRQMGELAYVANVTYQEVRRNGGVQLIIPPEGFEFFKELADLDQRTRRTKKIYIQVLSGSKNLVLGTRYSKNKPLGERYTW